MPFEFLIFVELISIYEINFFWKNNRV